MKSGEFKKLAKKLRDATFTFVKESGKVIIRISGVIVLTAVVSACVSAALAAMAGMAILPAALGGFLLIFSQHHIAIIAIAELILEAIHHL